MFGALGQRRTRVLAATLCVVAVGAACSSVKGVPTSDVPAAPVGARGPSAVAPAAVIAAVNQMRATHGLPSYARNAQLDVLARGWSSHMAAAGQFAHRDLQATIERPEFGGYQQLGENILRGACALGASEMVKAWMDSPGHRDNLLSPLYDTTGVGVVCASDGQVWVTQNFGAPLTP